MKYKAVFVDVDDTLVPHGRGNLPTKRVKDAIAACSDKAVAVCLATSRPFFAAEDIIASLPSLRYCVVAGGAQIYDVHTKTMVQEVLYPASEIDSIVTLARREGLKIGAFDGVNDVGLTGKNDPQSIDHLVGLFFPEVPLSKIDDVVEEIRKNPKVSVHKMLNWDKTHGWLDVTHPEATKLHGIHAVSKLMNIETHEMIGVGDGYNDFPLLLACGLKIAMGNAVPELKAIADFVAPPVDEDGVAVVIEKFILNV